MAFFSKLFGKEKIKLAGNVEEAVQQALDGLLDRAGFDLVYELEATAEGLKINFSGHDAKVMTEKDGLVLDSFQTYVRRIIQNKFPTEKADVIVDCEGYLDASAQNLRELADKLKKSVVEKGQPAFVRALPPRDRKVIHRHLADDTQVKSQSVGEGFCKKIKIMPAQPRANSNVNAGERPQRPHDRRPRDGQRDADAW